VPPLSGSHQPLGIYDFCGLRPLGPGLWVFSLSPGSLRRAGSASASLTCRASHPAGMEDPPALSRSIRRMDGTGRFRREKVSRPEPLKGSPRPYSRYGISRQLFRTELESAGQPTAVARHLPDDLLVPRRTGGDPHDQRGVSRGAVIPRGIYARLCEGHALRFAGADHVVTASGREAVKAVQSILRSRGVDPDPGEVPLEVHPYAAFDLLPELDAIALLTSWGCPYRCPKV